MRLRRGKVYNSPSPKTTLLKVHLLPSCCHKALIGRERSNDPTECTPNELVLDQSWSHQYWIVITAFVVPPTADYGPPRTDL